LGELVQTLVASLFLGDDASHRAEEGARRVEAWYSRLWSSNEPTHFFESHPDGLGLHLWDRPRDSCAWPSWHSDQHATIATLHVPFGHERVTGSTTPAPTLLATRLAARPAEAFKLSPPFVLTAFEKRAGTITMFTDSLGIGRLYEVVTDQSRVWSNRPVAALLFSGLRAEADQAGWLRMATIDWPMGDATAYSHVRTVEPATRIMVDKRGHREASIDPLRLLMGQEDDLRGDAGAASSALVSTMRGVRDMWSERPVLSLSGGRDSRLVAAAALAAGLDLELVTSAGIPEEVETAQRLVSLAPSGVAHTVTEPVAERLERDGAGALVRARTWHAFAEGTAAATKLRFPSPQRVFGQEVPLITGAGGELAHGFFFPPDIVRIEAMSAEQQLETLVAVLLSRLAVPRGTTPESRNAVRAQIETVLTHAMSAGLNGSRALTWFYADERLRRWGYAGENRRPKVIPLIEPRFVAAAFSLTTEQQQQSHLHRLLIASLVPQWADVPFFSASLRQRQDSTRRRLWEEADLEEITAVIADPSSWGAAFDVRVIQKLWRQACRGNVGARDELLLQRVIWRAAFSDHLDALNGVSGPRRDSASPIVPSRPRRSRWSPVRAVAVRMNDLPAGKRLARTRLGQALRRRIGV
jgi:hypothetical protein